MAYSPQNHLPGEKGLPASLVVLSPPEGKLLTGASPLANVQEWIYRSERSVCVSSLGALSNSVSEQHLLSSPLNKLLMLLSLNYKPFD